MTTAEKEAITRTLPTSLEDGNDFKSRVKCPICDWYGYLCNCVIVFGPGNTLAGSLVTCKMCPQILALAEQINTRRAEKKV